MTSIVCDRLSLATAIEMDRMRLHLSARPDTSPNDLARIYQHASDNTLKGWVRPLFARQHPTYADTLRVIYRKLRSFGEGLDETWQSVRSLSLWSYQAPIDSLDVAELEELVLKLYSAGVRDVKRSTRIDTRSARALASYLPGALTASGSVLVASAAQTAFKLPFASAAPGLAAGPIGIGLSAALLGAQAAGPAYRKIVPATIELMLIDRRIKNTPQD